jgi:recombination protein RecT
MADTGTKTVALIDDVRRDLVKMRPQFENALPAHIPVERFERVVMTALQNNPKLLACRRQSLFNACMRAAQDGLLPDGREGAIVPFGDDGDDGKKSADTASWMPMILGIRKKARNSGEISDWYAEVVHEGDDFEYVKGDDPHLFHRPSLVGGRTRKITAAYSICKFKDGTIAREVMTIAEVEDVRQKYSRAKKGPWSDPIAYPEMVRKTVARLHSKSLPMSTDLDTLIRRDDELYDMTGASDRAAKPPRRIGTRSALDHFAGGAATPTDGNGHVIEHGTDGIVIDNEQQTSAGDGHAAGGGAPAPASGAGPGAGATSDTKSKPAAEPKTQATYVAWAGNWRDAINDDAELERRWDAEKVLRNRCNVEPDTRDSLHALLTDKIAMLRARKAAPAGEAGDAR